MLKVLRHQGSNKLVFSDIVWRLRKYLLYEMLVSKSDSTFFIIELVLFLQRCTNVCQVDFINALLPSLSVISELQEIYFIFSSFFPHKLNRWKSFDHYIKPLVYFTWSSAYFIFFRLNIFLFLIKCVLEVVFGV
jgi:hypothetical protein